MEESSVEEEVEVTSEVETIVIMSNETDSFAVNGTLLDIGDNATLANTTASATDSSATQAGNSTLVASANVTTADSNSTSNAMADLNLTLAADGNSSSLDVNLTDAPSYYSSEVPSSAPSYFPTTTSPTTISPTLSPSIKDPNTCIDESDFEYMDKDCATYLATGRPNVLKNRCNTELDYGLRVQDYCRKTCSNCPAPVPPSSAPNPQPDEVLSETPPADQIEEEPTPEVSTVCEDHPTFKFEGKDCGLFLSTGRPAVLKNRCERVLENGYMVQDYCRLSCSICIAGEVEDEMTVVTSAAPTSQSPTEPFAPTSQPNPAPTASPVPDFSDFTVCENDPSFEFEGEDCAQYLRTGRPTVFKRRCEKELDGGYQVQDYCRLKCGNCPTAEEFAEEMEALEETLQCEDHPKFRLQGENCAKYLDTLRPTVLESRCERVLNNGYMVRDYCRLGCGVCVVASAAPSTSTAPTSQPTVDYSCKNDPTFEFDGKGCDLYLSTGRPAVLKGRCEKELDDGYQVQDYCRLRCDNCLTEEEIEALKNATPAPTATSTLAPSTTMSPSNTTVASEFSSNAAIEDSDPDDEGSSSELPVDVFLAPNGTADGISFPVDVSLDPNGTADEISFPSNKTAAAACPMIYRPVCSTDGFVFSNDCIAGAAGKEVLCTIEETDDMTAQNCTCELSGDGTADSEGGINSTLASNSTILSLNETLANKTISDAGLNLTLDANVTSLGGIVDGTVDTNFTTTMLDGNSTLSLNETLANETISETGLNATLEANATSPYGIANGTVDTNLTTTFLDGNLTEVDLNATLSDSDYGNSTGAELNTTLLNSTSLGINDTSKLNATNMYFVRCY